MQKSEEIKRLEADMASNKELNEKFNKTVDRIAGEKTAQSDGELFAKAAQELGYSVTAADFEKLDAEREEVNTDELEQVAAGYDRKAAAVGGGWCLANYYCEYAWNREQDEKGHDKSCITAWHCFAATLHTESEDEDTYCWSNYRCLFIVKDTVSGNR